ncbi:hypothetical protein psyc5s11_49870 [Clostridium gelidum]|uniref:Uncharacterized protein n=1 Tax=Clostridium gelidum TaxID=704125 RepID=A0ABM7TAI0_9CLOT|nr:hypothetical protein psyc5s11_49870 [Clostridium gelidum]
MAGCAQLSLIPIQKHYVKVRDAKYKSSREKVRRMKCKISILTFWTFVFGESLFGRSILGQT